MEGCSCRAAAWGAVAGGSGDGASTQSRVARSLLTALLAALVCRQPGLTGQCGSAARKWVMQEPASCCRVPSW